MASKKGKTKARSHTASKSNRKRRNPAASKAEKAGANETLLPAVGTVIQKLDRNGKVRCECVVAKNGIRYAGNLYRSLSGAAAGAAKDLGLSGDSFNGYLFWGLKKPGQRDPLDRVERFWQRYSNAVSELLKAEAPPDQKDARVARIRQHAAQLQTVAA